MNAAREAWFEGQIDLDPTQIVFIDETAANTKMARLYGRAPRGERCRAAVPHGHWKTTTFTAALRAAAAQTIPDLWQAIADALRRFTPKECANYLAAAGYDAT